MNESKELADEAPLGYRLDHPMHGTEMSIHQPDDDWANRGWVVTPLYAPQGDGRAVREALEPFAAISLVRDTDPNGLDMIDAPDLAITPNDVRRAREVLSAPPSVALEAYLALQQNCDDAHKRRFQAARAFAKMIGWTRISRVDGSEFTDDAGTIKTWADLELQIEAALTRPQPGGAVAGTERKPYDVRFHENQIDEYEASSVSLPSHQPSQGE